jgi:hypothetical protein
VELFPSRVSVSCSLDCAVKLVSPASDQRSSLRFLIKLGECLWSKKNNQQQVRIPYISDLAGGCQL